ncbi:MAG TPA: DUF72 domain-containing protein [Vicinamibacterales bacterium]|nr:DUF72 domain-containing protein [Vicinamibacterales bacterium]
MDLRIGTSGWHYPGGRGTWNGLFYPVPEDRPKGFDELAFYAERFNTVEVNSTFYGQPRATVSLAWVRRTPPGFEFSVKLFQKFTHPATALDRSAVTPGDVDAFKVGIEPLAAAGRMGALLAQFPARFHAAPESRGYLDWLLRTFAAYPLAVELRHRSWSDDAGVTAALLASHEAAWVQIDEPKFPSSVRQDLSPNSSRLMYVRLHGRNAAGWWAPAQAEDRYNYLYPESELTPLVLRLRAVRAKVRVLYLYLNNHFAAQAVANATMVREMLDEPVTAPMPGELVAAYPMLEGRVATLPRARLL